METHDPDDLPISVFWRVVYLVNGVLRVVDGWFYHSSVQEALDDYAETEEIIAQSQGIPTNTKVGAHIVERRH